MSPLPTNMQNGNERGVESKSLSLDLEALNSKYNNLLLSYKQALSDYEESLKADYSKPCGKYTLNDKIDENCYMDVWNKAGCKTGNQDPAGTWWPFQTLQTLIQDSWLWATMQDDTHRFGCYNTNQGPYMVIGTGTDGRLYYKNNLNAAWVLINDGGYGLKAVCTMPDGVGIYGVGSDGTIYSKPSYDATSWSPLPNPNGRCCVISASSGPDGTIVGVGTDYVTWSVAPGDTSSWERVQYNNGGEWLISLCIAPNGNIFCTNGNGIFMKSNYLNMNNIGWTYLGNQDIGIIALTIAPDDTLLGVGNNYVIYTAGNYQNVGSEVTWQGPVSGGGQVTGITTIVNQNYNPLIYSKATSPNYNISGETMSQMQAATFWGTSSVGQTNGGSLQDCVASCSTTPGCTGATYNQSAHGQPYCWLRGGSGTIGPGMGGSTENSDFAIVPKTKQLLKNVNAINQELTSLNKIIQGKLENMPNVYATQNQARINKDNDLKGQYSKLEKDRRTIKNKIDEYQSLENTQNASDAHITQNYVAFFILLGIVIIGVIVLAMFSLDKKITDAVKFTVSSGAASVVNISKVANPFYILFGIILVIVIVYLYNEYSYNVYSGVMSISKNTNKQLVIVIIFAIVVAFTFVSKMQKK